MSCNLTARKSALFTAQGLERGQEPGLPLTLKEKANPVMEQRRAILVRQMIEIQSQSTKAIGSVEQAEKLCEMWRDDRDSNQDRFDVDDPRPRAAIEAERNMSAAILASRQKVANGGEPQSRPESKSSLRRARKNKMNEENAMENESVVDNNGVKEEPRTEEGNDEVGSSDKKETYRVRFTDGDIDNNVTCERIHMGFDVETQFYSKALSLLTNSCVKSLRVSSKDLSDENAETIIGRHNENMHLATCNITHLDVEWGDKKQHLRTISTQSFDSALSALQDSSTVTQVSLQHAEFDDDECKQVVNMLA